jgi:hypothetical protein
MGDQEGSGPIDVEEEFQLDDAEQDDSEQEGSEQIGIDQDGFVRIAGELIKLPTITIGDPQPAKDKAVTAWFLANSAVHKGSAKIFDIKSKPVCISQ